MMDLVLLTEKRLLQMNKSDICVTIDSKEKQQRAIEILNKHGESFGKFTNAMDFTKTCNSLFFGSLFWYVGYNTHLTKITLDQLDELLTQQK